MAPDLNAVASGDSKWDYSTPGSTGYDIPDVILNVCLAIELWRETIHQKSNSADVS